MVCPFLEKFIDTHHIRSCVPRATAGERHDPHRRRAINHHNMRDSACYRTGDDGHRVNDTSVIRSPATKKAGRLDSYLTASQAVV